MSADLKSRDLKGRVAVVTGAGRGIGQEYARRLGEDGATVVVADIDGESAAVVAKEIRRGGQESQHVGLDIADPGACVRAVDDVVAQHGRLDILINNAGLFSGAGFALAEDLALAKWQQMIDVNISGTFFMCRAVIPHMKHAGWGRIINQGSVSAYTTYPRSIHYSMSKAAISTMTKTLARELGAFGVTVNAIAPGVIDTDAAISVLPSEALERASKQTSVGRIGHPEDLSPVVSFLCSAGAGYITGQTIVVDGGATMLG